MLVIFDCDGVLVDSEPLANQSFSRALKPHGLDWSVEETMRRLMGLSLKSCFEIVGRFKTNSDSEPSNPCCQNLSNAFSGKETP